MFAAREIKAGEEMTTSYSALLWSTPFRQINLAHTKHFRCRCDRCADPTVSVHLDLIGSQTVRACSVFIRNRSRDLRIKSFDEISAEVKPPFLLIRFYF